MFNKLKLAADFEKDLVVNWDNTWLDNFNVCEKTKTKNYQPFRV